MQALKFHKNKELPLHRLPFVGGKSKTRLGLSFWDVPATGGYSGGCDTGAALALLWLKHVERRPATDLKFTLSAIVQDMSGTQDKTRLGQMVGFFEIIEHAISELVANSRFHITKDDAELLAKANAGLNYVDNEPEYDDD